MPYHIISHHIIPYHIISYHIKYIYIYIYIYIYMMDIQSSKLLLGSWFWRLLLFFLLVTSEPTKTPRAQGGTAGPLRRPFWGTSIPTFDQSNCLLWNCRNNCLFWHILITCDCLLFMCLRNQDNHHFPFLAGTGHWADGVQVLHHPGSMAARAMPIHRIRCFLGLTWYGSSSEGSLCWRCCSFPKLIQSCWGPCILTTGWLSHCWLCRLL